MWHWLANCRDTLLRGLKGLWATREKWNWGILFVLILAMVLLLLYIENPETKKGGFVGFVEKRASDILMAFLVAFMGTLLVRVESLKNALMSHRNKWKQSCKELESLGKNLSGTQEKLNESRETLINSMDLSEDMRNIYDRFMEKAEHEMATSVVEKSTKLAEGWTKYISPQAMGAGDEGVRHLERMCWQFAFESYMKEEYKDIVGEDRRPGEPPGPKLATNYPTYLEFLKKISDTFTTAVLKTQFKPCFLSLADTFPVEWVMISDRRVTSSDVAFECAIDERLAKWRKTSADLAKYPEVVFRRVFLTTSNPDVVWKTLFVPRSDIFESQLNMYVWTLRDDPDMKQGMERETLEKIAKEARITPMGQNISIRDNSSGVFVSRISDTEKPSCTVDGIPYVLQKPAKSLREIVLDDLHKPPLALTARITDITEEILGQYDLRPTDLLIIGLLPKDKELRPNSPLIDHMIPLIGVECRARDPLSNISVLSLYSSKQIEDNLKGWVQLLESNSQPLGG